MNKASLLIMTVTPMSLVTIRAYTFALNHGAGGNTISGGILITGYGKDPETRAI
jgi:hypothetical protein